MESVESFGARLKREREQRKITLDEISLSTKIGSRFLLAIEEEHFDQLPGGIFNKGFVRAYARHLGLDEAQAIADYELASGASIPEPHPGIPVPGVPAALIQHFPSEDSGDLTDGMPWEWFAVALLVVACGLAVWGFHSPKPGHSPVAPVAGSTPAAAPARVGQTIVGQNSGAQAVDSLPGPGAFLVQIKAREDSWVTISADGRQVMQDTLYASAEKSVGARDQIVIKTGNAGALDISFNGKKLPTQGAHNQVKTLTFNPSGPKL